VTGLTAAGLVGVANATSFSHMSALALAGRVAGHLAGRVD
jgi:hypothetical protein